jgi:histidyl-tRNA synthetase
VRGFNYYTGIIFEVFDAHPDNNRSLFGGGRYDNLTSLFDDEAVAGVGFGMGDVTIHDFLSVRGLLADYVPPTQLYLAVAGEELVPFALEMARELREAGVSVAVDFADRKLADQLKAASKHKVPYVVVVGEREKESGSFTVRNMATGAEEAKSRDELKTYFN